MDPKTARLGRRMLANLMARHRARLEQVDELQDLDLHGFGYEPYISVRNDAGADLLEAVADKLGVDPCDLDEALHDLADREADYQVQAARAARDADRAERAQARSPYVRDADRVALARKPQ